MDNVKQQFKSVCIVGACPEFLKTKNGVKLRNSAQPDKVVEFSRKDWEELRGAFIENRI